MITLIVPLMLLGALALPVLIISGLLYGALRSALCALLVLVLAALSFP